MAIHIARTYRTQLIVLVLLVCLLAPQPVRAQFGIDWGAVVAAINSIGSRSPA